GQQAIDESQRERIGRRKSATEQQPFSRTLVPREARQQKAGGRLGNQAKGHKGQRESSVRSRVEQVAVKEQRGAHADSQARDGGDDGLRKGRQCAQESKHRRIGVLGRSADKVIEVVAGGENSCRAGKEYDPRFLLPGS